MSGGVQVDGIDQQALGPVFFGHVESGMLLLGLPFHEEVARSAPDRRAYYAYRDQFVQVGTQLAPPGQRVECGVSEVVLLSKPPPALWTVGLFQPPVRIGNGVAEQ